MAKFQFEELETKGAFLITPTVFGDDRGFFLEKYTQHEFVDAGIEFEIVQVNHSKSSQGVVRGLHFQKPPYAQAKLVHCIAGEILDVIVDMRKDSPTYGKHVSIQITAENKQMVFVPKGFAHGFATLSESAEILYFQDNTYHPEAEGGVIWSDPDLAIKWPFEDPLLSPKDMVLPFFKDTDSGF